ncbi:MAG TPA: hypothetical protein VGG22_07965 [Candidatus Baltobacteraceae bacterium]|jgi:hypothetical protein
MNLTLNHGLTRILVVESASMDFNSRLGIATNTGVLELMDAINGNPPTKWDDQGAYYIFGQLKLGFRIVAVTTMAPNSILFVTTK